MLRSTYAAAGEELEVTAFKTTTAILTTVLLCLSL
jgi:hypothetical protein